MTTIPNFIATPNLSEFRCNDSVLHVFDRIASC